MRLIEKHTRRCVLERLEYATGFRRRLLGLIGRRFLPEGYGLYFPRCSSIHTCFMRFKIDILYVDRNWKVFKIVREMRPWRISGCIGAAGTVEIAAGRAEKCGIKNGAELQIIHGDEK